MDSVDSNSVHMMFECSVLLQVHVYMYIIGQRNKTSNKHETKPPRQGIDLHATVEKCKPECARGPIRLVTLLLLKLRDEEVLLEEFVKAPLEGSQMASRDKQKILPSSNTKTGECLTSSAVTAGCEYEHAN